MNTDESLDRAIDHVARELTSGAPSAGFAGRVHARLDRPAVLSRWRWQLAGAASALVAASIIVWAVWPGIPERMPGATTLPRNRQADRLLAGRSEQPATPQIASHTEQPVAVPARPRALPPSIRIPIDIESAPQIAAIAETEDLLVPTIEIAELTVAPLEPEKEKESQR